MIAAVPSLAAAVCQVWWATPRAVDPALLDAATRRRVVALRRAADRERCATAARLGDLLVAVHGGATAWVERTGGRAPRVHGADPGLHLSVAHAGDHVAVAIGACGPVGVDVEPRTAAVDAAALAAALTPAERRALGDLPRARRPATLLRQWVRKEAVLKAAGVGLAVDPAVLDVTVAGRRPCVVACPALPGVVGCAVCDLRGPAGAVAALASLALGVDAVEVDGDALLDAHASSA